MYGLYVVVAIMTTILTAVHAHDRDSAAMMALNQNDSQRQQLLMSPEVEHQTEHQRLQSKRRRRRRRRRMIILGPLLLLKTMLWDPVRRLDRQALFAIYSIDTVEHHDFFIVTISRLCYYCGGSVQTVSSVVSTVSFHPSSAELWNRSSSSISFATSFIFMRTLNHPWHSWLFVGKLPGP